MRTRHITILMLALGMCFLVGFNAMAYGEESDNENIWEDDVREGRREHRGPPEEMIDRILERLGEDDPKRAKELAELRKQDTEKFHEKFREVMHEQFGKNGKDWKGRGDRRHDRGDKRRERGERGDRRYGRDDKRKGHGDRRGGEREGRQRDKKEKRGMGHGGGRSRGNWESRHDDYLKWLGENYPAEAEKLEKLKDKKPELYRRHLGLSMRKYGKIAEASKENPALAKVLKANLELNNKRDWLLRKIRKADDAEKEGLKAELKDVLSDKFDLIVKRKYLEYEQLAKKLESLKNQVKKSEEKVEKWKDAEFKSKNVESRLKELLSRKEKFKWE
ncbi:MAG: hypothetical protein FVQ80_07745 [Planctomycetes bacterium]|nr:hypothetical protein [Planctomycetota bacterium]